MEILWRVISWKNGGKFVGIKKYKLVVTEQTGGCKEQYKKWGNQRTCMHDPWA